MARPHIRPADDLGKFVQIADYLLAGKPLREIADLMKISISAVEDVIDRMNRNYGVSLVDKQKGIPATLSESGRKLRERISECLDEPFKNERQIIRVRVSYSLLQNNMLFPSIIDDWRRLTGINVDVLSTPELNYDHELNRLLTGSLDLLIAWAVPNRVKQKISGIEFKEIGPRFPLALVAYDPETLKACIAEQNKNNLPYEPARLDFATLVNEYKCATLDVSKQPLADRLAEEGLYSLSNRRIEVTSFHAVIDLVRARVADVGIIPMAGRDLDGLRLHQQLFYQILNDTVCDDGEGIRIAAVRRSRNVRTAATDPKSPTPDADERSNSIDAVIASINKFLPEESRTSGEAPDVEAIAKGFFNNKGVLCPLPSDDDRHFYERIKHGYFLITDLVRTSEDKPTRPQWRHEDVDIVFKERIEDKPLEIDAKQSWIVNEVKDKFQIEYARIIDGAFFFAAKKVNDVTGDSENSGFVALFNSRVMVPESVIHTFGWSPEQIPSIIVGVWSGGAGQRRVATWAVIYSSVPLTERARSIIARRASLNVSLNSLAVD